MINCNALPCAPVSEGSFGIAAFGERMMPFQVEILRMPASPWWKDLLPLVGVILGAALSLVVEAVRRRVFSPRLRVVKVFTKPTSVPGKDNKYWKSTYVKIEIKNKSRVTAKDAKAYITKIEEYDNGYFKESEFFQDTLRLRWAYEPQEEELHAGIDIPKHIPFHIDIMSIKIEDYPEPTRIIQCSNKYLRFNSKGGLLNQIKSGKRYRFHVALAAENTETRSIVVDVIIGPAWELSHPVIVTPSLAP